MRKVFVSVLLAMLILSACNSSTLSFSEIKNVPHHVQEIIDSDSQLQLISEEEGSYVIFLSDGDLEATIDSQDNIVTIIFNELNPQDDAVKQNVYYLTTDSEHDTVNVLVNGESMPFDNVTGI